MMELLSGVLEFLGVLVVIIGAGGMLVAYVYLSAPGEQSPIDIDDPHDAPFGNPNFDSRVTSVSDVKPGTECHNPRYFDAESGEHRFL